MKVVIMAGGKGTRISSVADKIPKPMIPIGGKPVLEHEISCLREQGFKDIIITVSHLGKIIMDYFRDGSGVSPVTGEPFGVNIEYYFEKEPLGNAGALFQIKEKLTDDFLLLNADVMFDIDFKRLVDYHHSNDGYVTLLTHPNNHPYDSGLIIADDKNIVQRWITKEDEHPIYYKNRVNAGIHVLSKKVLNLKIDEKKIDLDRHILKPLQGTGKLYVYDSPEYVRDMGTPERYNDICNDYINGKIRARNLLNKQKAIFLDRDGTINTYVGFLDNIEKFELLPGVVDAIKEINKSGYLAIVVTNQPVIARGELTFDELKEIHNKMETLLGNSGAYLDAIYFCPHHTDRGFEGEIAELKFDCECRKPKSGMFFKAMNDFNIDLEQSYMVGDSQNDIIAGKNAGCKTVLIGEKYYGQDLTVKSLEEFSVLLNKEKGYVN